LAIFFLFPARSFCGYHSNLDVGNFSPKTQGTNTKAARCLFFLSVPSLYICHLLFLFTFCHVCLLVKETAEIETGMAEKFYWEQANIHKN
jgi:hypothetical protein